MAAASAAAVSAAGRGFCGRGTAGKLMAVKPAKPSTVRAAPAVAAAAAGAAGRGLAVAAAAAAIYKSEYSCGSFYSLNAYQHTYLLGPKSRTQNARLKTAAAWTKSSG